MFGKVPVERGDERKARELLRRVDVRLELASELEVPDVNGPPRLPQSRDPPVVLFSTVESKHLNSTSILGETKCEMKLFL